jgi:hypothetical protein
VLASSWLPVNNLVPSGEKSTLITPPIWPENVLIKPPVSLDHNLAVLSSLPVKTFVPSGEKAAE